MAIITKNFQMTVERQAQRVMQQKVNARLVKEFEKDKKILLKEFDKHDVTKELSKEEPERVTKSKFLDYGNLFSLIGAEEGTDIPGIIREVLEENIRVKRKAYFVKSRGDRYTFAVSCQYPDDKEVNNATKILEWTTRGVVDLIENGTPGFSRYLFSLVRGFKNSRSGTAIQLKKRVLREGSFGGTPYVSNMLKRFAKGIRE